MYITACSNKYYISFKSHSKEVRDAEQIMRKTQSTFPMVSPTRITAFYHTQHKPVTSQINDKVNKMQAEIYKMRSRADLKKKLAKCADNAYRVHIEDIEKNRMGNCYESAIMTAAALCANGYNSDVATLYVVHNFIDKKTKQIEYREGAFLDHAFAVTDMGRDITDRNRQIILDPWVGICGEWDEINSKYHALFAHDSDLEQFLDNDREEFKNRLEDEYPDKNISDYEEKIGFTYRPIYIGKINRDKAKEYLRKKYPQLILNA